MTLPRKSEPVYLARHTYRQRRLRDATRILPIAGAVFWILPLIAARPLTSTTGLYLFGVWFVMICISAAIAWRIEDDEDNDPISRENAADAD